MKSGNEGGGAETIVLLCHWLNEVESVVSSVSCCGLEVEVTTHVSTFYESIDCDTEEATMYDTDLPF